MRAGHYHVLPLWLIAVCGRLLAQEAAIEHSDYYVSAALGDDSRTAAAARSPDTPWRTVSRAAEEAKAGDRVRVMPGLYRECVRPTRGGNAAWPVIYQAHDPATRPVLDGSLPVAVDGWERVPLTNYLGTVRTVLRHAIGWVPSAAFLGEQRLLAAQEPDPADADNPYDLAFFRPVPSPPNDNSSRSALVDPAFLTQLQTNFWVGGRLLLHDSLGNVIHERVITGYDPGLHRITTEAFPATIGSGDRYAIRGHLAVLDKEGEFHVDAAADPPLFYVLPPPGHDPAALTAAYAPHAFDLAYGDLSDMVIDGFEIRFFEDHGIDLRNGGAAITVRNCRIHRCMGAGVSVRSAAGITVSNCLVQANHDDGIYFGAGSDYAVVGCEITANGNNGIWAGTGSNPPFGINGVRIAGNHIHHHKGRRMHPDNCQTYGCDNLVFEGNLLEQDGDQNVWCEFSGSVSVRNNIVLSGTFGLNSAIISHVHHNTFSGLSLRYDAHLTDHPVLGDYFKPQQAVLRDNLFIGTRLSWPAAAVVDRFAVFTVDHDYFNSENADILNTWEWQGYQCGVNRGGSMLVCTQDVQAAGSLLRSRVATSWSEPGRLVVLYKDSTNYYSIGFGSTAGIYRRMDGVEARLHADPTGLLRLPHTSLSTGLYAVAVTNDGAAITILAGRDEVPGSYDILVRDAVPAAVARFAGPVRVGLMTTSPYAGTPACFIDDVQLDAMWTDGFDDGDFTAAEGNGGLAWAVLYGGAGLAGVKGSGVGFGEGSIVHTNRSLLATMVVTPPGGAAAPDFHLRPHSPLIDAGIDVGVTVDFDGRQRPAGSRVDIGSYEYVAPPRHTVVIIR